MHVAAAPRRLTVFVLSTQNIFQDPEGKTEERE